MDLAGAGDDAVLTIVMRDVGGFLVPPGDAVVPAGQHVGFIAHMAALASAFWGWDDQIGLTTMAQRVRLFAPDTIAAELTAAEVPAAIAAAAAGWGALPGRSPLLSRLARLVHDRPEVITGPLSRTPRTFLAGDWKMGNLGTHPDGRTILLDWALPGAGPACWDLCWYLALNRARLPEPKEAAISRFRAALEHHGIDTGSWWQQQLDLCMIGIMATFGWEKALGDAGELSWWEATARRRGHPPAHPGSGIAGAARRGGAEDRGSPGGCRALRTRRPSAVADSLGEGAPPGAASSPAPEPAGRSERARAADLPGGAAGQDTDGQGRGGPRVAQLAQHRQRVPDHIVRFDRAMPASVPATISAPASYSRRISQASSVSKATTSCTSPAS